MNSADKVKELIAGDDKDFVNWVNKYDHDLIGWMKKNTSFKAQDYFYETTLYFESPFEIVDVYFGSLCNFIDFLVIENDYKSRMIELMEKS